MTEVEPVRGQLLWPLRLTWQVATARESGGSTRGMVSGNGATSASRMNATTSNARSMGLPPGGVGSRRFRLSFLFVGLLP